MTTPSLGWGCPALNQFPSNLCSFFLKATAGVCPVQQHTLGGGSRATQGAGPTSHQQPHSSPAHPGTGHQPWEHPCDAQSAQAAKHQPQQPLLQNTKIDRTPVLGTFKPISPSLQLQPEQKAPSTFLSPILRVSCAPQSSLLRDKVLLCHSSSSHCPSQGKTSISFYVHKRKALSKKAIMAERLRCLLCEQDTPHGIKIPRSLGDALGRAEGLSLALGTVGSGSRVGSTRAWHHTAS